MLKEVEAVSAVACQAKETTVNEFEKVDAVVHSIIGHKQSKSDDNKIVQNQLEKLELSIQDLEEVLERLLRLSSLEDLHDSVGDLLALPHIEHALAQEHDETWVDEVVDGYLRLLDVCSTAKDTFSQAKQAVQDLLSMLRRRRDANDFQGYLASRKMVKKAIKKSLKDLKSIKNKSILLPKDKDSETVAIFSMLTEVEAATLAVFESLLSYVGRTKVQLRQKSWSWVSKLMQHKSVESQDEANGNEFEKLDGALKGGKFDNIQNQLGKMESSIEDIESRLECLFRRLIKTRVSLLNILNNH
ncbi:hypothetical protein ACSBR2_019714 [Camellia fascicularis]